MRGVEGGSGAAGGGLSPWRPRQRGCLRPARSPPSVRGRGGGAVGPSPGPALGRVAVAGSCPALPCQAAALLPAQGAAARRGSSHPAAGKGSGSGVGTGCGAGPRLQLRARRPAGCSPACIPPGACARVLVPPPRRCCGQREPRAAGQPLCLSWQKLLTKGRATFRREEEVLNCSCEEQDKGR